MSFKPCWLSVFGSPGLMLFAPFLGSVVIPARIKAALTFALTLVLYPLVSKSFPSLPINEWPILVLRELLLGVAIGIATSIVFEAVQMAGQVLSVQMGYSLINILDPNTQVDTTVVAMFQQSIAMLIFLRMDVHLLAAEGGRQTALLISLLEPLHLTRPFHVELAWRGYGHPPHWRSDRGTGAFRKRF